MEININAIKELINNEYRGNQSWFAEDIDINISYLNEILNGKKSPNSSKVCVAIIKWCEQNKRNYKNYIFLH